MYWNVPFSGMQSMAQFGAGVGQNIAMMSPWQSGRPPIVAGNQHNHPNFHGGPQHFDFRQHPQQQNLRSGLLGGPLMAPGYGPNHMGANNPRMLSIPSGYGGNNNQPQMGFRGRNDRVRMPQPALMREHVPKPGPAPAQLTEQPSKMPPRQPPVVAAKEPLHDQKPPVPEASKKAIDAGETKIRAVEKKMAPRNTKEQEKLDELKKAAQQWQVQQKEMQAQQLSQPPQQMLQQPMLQQPPQQMLQQPPQQMLQQPPQQMLQQPPQQMLQQPPQQMLQQPPQQVMQQPTQQMLQQPPQQVMTQPPQQMLQQPPQQVMKQPPQQLLQQPPQQVMKQPPQQMLQQPPQQVMRQPSQQVLQQPPQQVMKQPPQQMLQQQPTPTTPAPDIPPRLENNSSVPHEKHANRNQSLSNQASSAPPPSSNPVHAPVAEQHGRQQLPSPSAAPSQGRAFYQATQERPEIRDKPVTNKENPQIKPPAETPRASDAGAASRTAAEVSSGLPAPASAQKGSTMTVEEQTTQLRNNTKLLNEFEKQLNNWNSQFESWRQQNQEHPDRNAFHQYENQWRAWREKLVQRHAQMKLLCEQQSAKLAARNESVQKIEPSPKPANSNSVKDLPEVDNEKSAPSEVLKNHPANVNPSLTASVATGAEGVKSQQQRQSVGQDFVPHAQEAATLRTPAGGRLDSRDAHVQPRQFEDRIGAVNADSRNPGTLGDWRNSRGPDMQGPPRPSNFTDRSMMSDDTSFNPGNRGCRPLDEPGRNFGRNRFDETGPGGDDDMGGPFQPQLRPPMRDDEPVGRNRFDFRRPQFEEMRRAIFGESSSHSFSEQGRFSGRAMGMENERTDFMDSTPSWNRPSNLDPEFEEFLMHRRRRNQFNMIPEDERSYETRGFRGSFQDRGPNFDDVGRGGGFHPDLEDREDNWSMSSRGQFGEGPHTQDRNVNDLGRFGGPSDDRNMNLNNQQRQRMQLMDLDSSDRFSQGKKDLNESRGEFCLEMEQDGRNVLATSERPRGTGNSYGPPQSERGQPDKPFDEPQNRKLGEPFDGPNDRKSGHSFDGPYDRKSGHPFDGPDGPTDRKLGGSFEHRGPLTSRMPELDIDVDSELDNPLPNSGGPGFNRMGASEGGGLASNRAGRTQFDSHGQNLARNTESMEDRRGPRSDDRELQAAGPFSGMRGSGFRDLDPNRNPQLGNRGMRPNDGVGMSGGENFGGAGQAKNRGQPFGKGQTEIQKGAAKANVPPKNPNRERVGDASRVFQAASKNSEVGVVERLRALAELDAKAIVHNNPTAQLGNREESFQSTHQKQGATSFKQGQGQSTSSAQKSLPPNNKASFGQPVKQSLRSEAQNATQVQKQGAPVKESDSRLSQERNQSGPIKTEAAPQSNTSATSQTSTKKPIETVTIDDDDMDLDEDFSADVDIPEDQGTWGNQPIIPDLPKWHDTGDQSRSEGSDRPSQDVPTKTTALSSDGNRASDGSQLQSRLPISDAVAESKPPVSQQKPLQKVAPGSRGEQVVETSSNKATSGNLQSNSARGRQNESLPKSSQKSDADGRKAPPQPGRGALLNTPGGPPSKPVRSDSPKDRVTLLPLPNSGKMGQPSRGGPLQSDGRSDERKPLLSTPAASRSSQQPANNSSSSNVWQYDDCYVFMDDEGETDAAEVSELLAKADDSCAGVNQDASRTEETFKEKGVFHYGDCYVFMDEKDEDRLTKRVKEDGQLLRRSDGRKEGDHRRQSPTGRRQRRRDDEADDDRSDKSSNSDYRRSSSRYRERTSERHRSSPHSSRHRSPIRRYSRSPSPGRGRRRSRSPRRSKSPQRPVRRSRSPQRPTQRSRSPERPMRRSRSPEHPVRCSRSPDRQMRRSRSPERSLGRSRSPQRPIQPPSRSSHPTPVWPARLSQPSETPEWHRGDDDDSADRHRSFSLDGPIPTIDYNHSHPQHMQQQRFQEPRLQDASGGVAPLAIAGSITRALTQEEQNIIMKAALELKAIQDMKEKEEKKSTSAYDMFADESPSDNRKPELCQTWDSLYDRGRSDLDYSSDDRDVFSGNRYRSVEAGMPFRREDSANLDRWSDDRSAQPYMDTGENYLGDDRRPPINQGHVTIDYGHRATLPSSTAKREVFDYGHAPSSSSSSQAPFFRPRSMETIDYGHGQSASPFESDCLSDAFNIFPSVPRNELKNQPYLSEYPESSPSRRSPGPLYERSRDLQWEQERDREWGAQGRDEKGWEREREYRTHERAKEEPPARRDWKRESSRDTDFGKEKQSSSDRAKDSAKSREAPKKVPSDFLRSVDKPIFPVSTGTKLFKFTGSSVLIEDLLGREGRRERPSKIVIILRGLPGSGKTYVAKLIKDKEVEAGGSAPRILCLDDYYMVEAEKLEVDPDTGKKIKVKVMQYEYEPEVEANYRASLFKAFKKTVEDGFFPFIIVDAVHAVLKEFEEMASFSKQKGFQVYIVDMEADAATCQKRNVHGRTLGEITKIIKRWQRTSSTYSRLDVRSLLQDDAITEVEMVDAAGDNAEKEERFSMGGERSLPDILIQQLQKPLADCKEVLTASKWEKMENTEEKLDKLDGLRSMKKKKDVPQTLEDYLQLPDDYEERKSQPGKKRVRWADIEEGKSVERRRALGFVVGQTDWKKIVDPTHAQRALTSTKYF